MNFFVRSLGVVAVAVSMASCGGGGGASTVTGVGGGGGGGVTPTDCSNGTFCMGATQFVPTTATAARNALVTWVNSSGIVHNVTFDNPPGAVGAAPGGSGGDISTIDGNATATRTFATAGVYAFHCNIHPGMSGTLTIQ